MLDLQTSKTTHNSAAAAESALLENQLELRNTLNQSIKNANRTYKIKSARKASLDLDELVLSMRGVTSECKHILDPIRLDRGEGVVDLLDRHVGAGEVHHALDAHHVLHPVGDLQRHVRRGPAGSPCDVAEGRVVRHHPLHPLEKVLDAVLRLRREELEREQHPVVIRRRRLVDLLYHLHLSTALRTNSATKTRTNPIQSKLLDNKQYPNYKFDRNSVENQIKSNQNKQNASCTEKNRFSENVEKWIRSANANRSE